MQLNDHLQSRTFLVGRSLTLADLVVFGVVQPATVRDKLIMAAACLRGSHGGAYVMYN